MTDSTEIVQAHCNQCLRETRQLVVAAKVQSYDDQTPDGEVLYSETTRYEMLECCGCENITLRSICRSCGEPDTNIAYFPPAVTRATPAWLSDFNFSLGHHELSSLFREVYAALHAGSNRLAIMGARALIDMVMLDKIGDRGSFNQKLQTMEKNGHISRTNRTYLDAAINAGHAAAHRGHRPDDKDVNRVMDIVENLVQAVYVLAPAADILRQNTPARPPKPPGP